MPSYHAHIQVLERTRQEREQRKQNRLENASAITLQVQIEEQACVEEGGSVNWLPNRHHTIRWLLEHM